MLAPGALSLMLIAAVSAPATAPAAPRPTVKMSVMRPPKLTVGDPFEVTLVVTAPKASLVTGPATDSTGAFVVSDVARKTRLRAGSDESTYRLRVAGFEPGSHRLPVFAFLVETEGRTDTLRSDTASVAIASVLPPKMQDIHPLAPPEKFPNLLLWLVPSALLLLGLLAWAARGLYLRLRSIQELTAAPLPPWEEAIAALDSMPWQEWLAAGQLKQYHYALSQVLKRYIERRFEFHAVEQTTTEMLASMRTHRTPMREEVARFFARSDLVKYAKSAPPADEAESAIAEVRAFVHKTKPQEPAAESAAAGTTASHAAGGARS